MCDSGGRRTFLLQMHELEFGEQFREPNEYEHQCMDREWLDGLTDVDFELRLRDELMRSTAPREMRDQGHAAAHLEEEDFLWQQYIVGISARPTRTFRHGDNNTPVYRY